MARTRYRIFVSSPGDMTPERQLVSDTIARLNASLQDIALDVYLSDNDLYFAHRGPQEGIPLTSEYDLVVCLLWKRMGTQLLPDSFDAPDGRKRTGTEFEFETAVEAARRNKTESGMPRPAVLVYRKTEAVQFNANRVDQELAQYRALLAFFERWVREVNGHYLGYANEFETAQQFSLMFERHLRDWLMLQRQDADWDIAQLGSPFRGLEVFDRKHETVFFGRDQCILDARARLKRAASGGFAALWIVGASGSGKSSLLRAGLLPSIERSEGFTRSVVFKPSELGKTLIDGLAARILQMVPEMTGGTFRVGDAFARVCVESPVSARTAIETALDEWAAAEAEKRALDRAPTTRLIIAVDQAEELLTSRTTAERDAFVALLLALLEGKRVWAVFSFRADFYATLQRDARLKPLKDRAAQFDLGVPTPTELAQMISEPARAAGLVMEIDDQQRSLAAEIAKDTGGADSLPMLEFALNALFERAQSRGERVLRVADYLDMGRAAGALSSAAEEILAQSPAPAQKAFPRVLRELVDLNLQSENRMPASRACEMEQFSGSADAKELIEALSRPETRLLSLFELDGRAYCRVSHESLFDRWPRAKEQIQADARRLDARRRLAEDAALWKDAAPVDKPQRLLENLSLEEALDLREHWTLTPLLHEFIDNSQRASRRRERRRKIVSATFAAAGAIAIGMAIYAQDQRDRAEESEARATQTLDEAARRSFGLMEDALASSDPAIAYAHLAESLRFRDTPQARLAASYQLQQVAFVPHASFPDIAVERAALSPDGNRVLLTASRESNLWETHTGRRLLPPLSHEPLGAARFSSDGRRIIGTNTKGAYLWDAESGKPTGQWLIPDAERMIPLRRAPRVSDDGSIAMLARSSDIEIFDLKNNRSLIRRANINRRTFLPQLARDGALVATSPSPETVRLLDAATLEPTGTQPVLPPGSRVTCLAFGPDGLLLIGLNPGGVAVWNPAHPALVPLQLSSPGCQRLVFSPDGEALAGVTSDAIEVWRTRDGERIDRIALATPVQRQQSGTTVEFSPDAMRLLVAYPNHFVRQWLRYPLREIGVPLRHGTALLSARYSSDGRGILTLADDGKSRLWDARSGSATELVVQHGDEITSTSLSQDGRWLATAATDGSIQIWSLLDGRPSGPRLAHPRGRGTFVQFSPDGSRLLTVDSAGSAAFSDRASGKRIGEPLASGVVAAAYSADGSLIATGDEQGLVTLRNAVNLRTVGEPIRHDGGVSRLAFSPDAKSLLVINSDRVAVWDLQSRMRRGVLEPGEPTAGVELSPRGDLLVTFNDDAIRLWWVDGMRRIDHGYRANGDLLSVHFSPDGEHLLATTDTGVHLLTDSGVERATFAMPSASTGAIYDSAGARVAVATDEGIELLDALTLARLGPPLRTREILPFTEIAFCPNDRCLTGLNEDASILIWNLAPTIDAPAHVVGETLATLGGVRVGASGRIEVFADSEQPRLFASEVLNLGKPELSAVVDWHFAARGERTVSPFSTLTQRSRNREGLERLITAANDGESEEAERIAADIFASEPEHPLIPIAMVVGGFAPEHRRLLIRIGQDRLLATKDAELVSRGAQLLQGVDEPVAALNVAEHALALDATDARAAGIRAWALSRQPPGSGLTPTAATSALAADPPATAR